MGRLDSLTNSVKIFKESELRQKKEAQKISEHAKELSESHDEYLRKNSEMALEMSDLKIERDTLAIQLGMKTEQIKEHQDEKEKLVEKLSKMKEEYDDKIANERNEADQILPSSVDPMMKALATGISNVSTQRSANNPQGQVETSIRIQTFQRIVDMQKETEKLSREKLALMEKSRYLEARLVESRNDRMEMLRSILSRLSPVLDSQWSLDTTKRLDQMSARPVNSNNNYKAVEISLIEGITKLEYMFKQNQMKLESVKQEYERLKDIPKSLQMTQKERDQNAAEAQELKVKLQDLQMEFDEQQEKLRVAEKSMTMDPEFESGAANYGKSAADILKSKDLYRQLSGTFVGQLWILRYKEMERKWKAERSKRKMEYEGYLQHVNECYDKITKQRDTIKVLKARINQLSITDK